MKNLLLPCILLFSALSTKAQLCNNNLGDPIINLNFGFRGNPQFPDKTTYSYMGGCPSKGNYTISDFLFGCGGYWVQLTGDHTPPPDMNGNYMLVNAESTPGTIMEDTATGLCSNMTYQFSAYIKNVMQDKLTCPNGATVLPNLTFIIESTSGAVLESYNTGDIPITESANWVQYGFTYQNTNNINAVVLKIMVNAKDGCGNAFAIDDIIFQSCGPLVSATIDGTIADQHVCANYTNPFLMQGSYGSGFANPIVQWQQSVDSGQTWIDIAGASTTTYTVPHRNAGVILYRMTVAEKANINSPACRMHSNPIYTEIHPLPEHHEAEYIHGCTGKDFELPSGDINAFDLLWTGPNSYTSSDRIGAVVPDFQFADTGLYLLKQTYAYNCFDLDSFYLSASPGISLSAQQPSPICEGQSETLSVNASSSGTYAWSPSTGLSNPTILNPVASPVDSTVYEVLATNSSGCQDSAFLTLNVYKKPIANAGADKLILSGDSTTLDGMVSGTAINFLWTPSSYMNNANAIQPKVAPPQDMSYTLTVNSTVGCGSASDDVNVKLYKGFFIPNSFTPNGDGKNDFFRLIPFDNYKLIRFVVYNRWGTAVFNSANIDKGWDGTYNGFPQPIGAYIYYIDLKNANGEHIIKQGTVTLLR